MIDQHGTGDAHWPPLSRRQALRLLGLPVGAALLGACGAGPISDELAFAIPDFAGVNLRAIMRNSFIDELNLDALAMGKQWGARVNASIDFDFRDDWREHYTVVAQAREGPDLAELFGNAAHLLSNRLVDLSEIAEEIASEQGGWFEAARDASVVDGVWRSIPWALTAQALNCRKDILKTAAAPQIISYEDLLEAATRLHDQSLPLAAFSMSPDAPNDSGSFAYSLLWSFGGQEVDARSGAVALDSEATRKALEFFKELSDVSDRRALSFSEGGNNDAFLKGEIAMTQNASSIFWKAIQTESDLVEVMDHVRYPVGDGGYHQLLEVNALAIYNHSRNIDAARDFVRFALRPSTLAQRGNLSLSFFSPPLLDMNEDPAMAWNSNAKLAGFKTLNEGGHIAGWPGTKTREAGLVFQNATIVRMFSAVADGSASVNEAVITATNELRRVYET